ncbi:exodeoxyribonuclease V subunit gamma [bacterium]|nr:exodeoxyribonuclease V subunit gamma [bacterium]
MGTSFILGRAGMGKTRRCLLEIGQALAERPDGPGLFLLAPEQATFQLERALLQVSGVSASFRAQVVSFRRLAYRAMSERGAAALDPVGGMERMLLLRRILITHRRQLARDGALAPRPALAAELAASFAELSRRGQSPESLLAVTGAPDLPPRLGEKLADLALIWRQYRDALAQRGLDPDTTLDRLTDLIKKSDWAAGARFWVDGFSGFSPQELAVLTALAERAESVRVSLCLDPQRLRELPRTALELDPTRLFYPTEATYLQLSALPRSGDDLHLAADPPPRHAEAPALARLERALAHDARETFPADGHIFVHAFANPREEIAAVAAQIARLVHDQGYHYRDIAVITRGMEDYASLARWVFEEAGIPHFLDQRVPLRSHPLMACAVAALALATRSSRSALSDLLRTGLSGLSTADVDRLDNHCFARGVDGFNYLDKTWPACAARLLSDLRALKTALHAQPALTGQAFAEVLFNFLSSRQVRQTLEAWCTEAEAAGRPAEAAMHRQAWEGLLDLLDPVASALGDEALPPDDWVELFSLGLSDLQCALVPPSLDQVLVGSIERSRHPDLRAAFFVGALEGTLPKPPGPGGLFTSSERRLLETLVCDVGPHAARLLAEENYLAYIAFTRPSERLFLTYPTHDANGREQVHSRWIDWVLQHAPDAQRVPDRAALDVFPRQRLARCLLQLRASTDPERHPALPRLRGLLAHPATRDLSLRAVAGLWHNDQAALSPAVLAELGLSSGPLAITALEDFGKCPFLHHAQRRLRLAERRPFQADALELGRLTHALLEHYGRLVIERGVDWSKRPAASQPDAAPPQGRGARNPTPPSSGSPSRAIAFCSASRRISCRACSTSSAASRPATAFAPAWSSRSSTANCPWNCRPAGCPCAARSTGWTCWTIPATPWSEWWITRAARPLLVPFWPSAASACNCPPTCWRRPRSCPMPGPPAPFSFLFPSPARAGPSRAAPRPNRAPDSNSAAFWTPNWRSNSTPNSPPTASPTSIN